LRKSKDQRRRSRTILEAENKELRAALFTMQARLEAQAVIQESLVTASLRAFEDRVHSEHQSELRGYRQREMELEDKLRRTQKELDVLRAEKKYNAARIVQSWYRRMRAIHTSQKRRDALHILQNFARFIIDKQPRASESTASLEDTVNRVRLPRRTLQRLSSISQSSK